MKLAGFNPVPSVDHQLPNVLGSSLLCGINSLLKKNILLLLSSSFASATVASDARVPPYDVKVITRVDASDFTLIPLVPKFSPAPVFFKLQPQ